MSDYQQWAAQYRALIDGAGLVDFKGQTLIEVAGPDRASFLHNFCTNDIRKLAPGAGCETFLTSIQGRTLAYVSVLSGANSFLLETAPRQAERIIAHLDHYILREKVSLRDRSSDWRELLLAGPQAEPILAGLVDRLPPFERLASVDARCQHISVWISRVDLTGTPGFLLNTERGWITEMIARLQTAGAVACGHEAWEAARIEAGTPLYGVDITDKNFPQEVARDERAISFTKGCYLGQETVARIDALGHVNRSLCGVRFHRADIPAHATQLTVDRTVIGEVTSAAYSPQLAAPLALAYVRRGNNQPGTLVESPLGRAEVIALPVRKPA